MYDTGCRHGYENVHQVHEKSEINQMLSSSIVSSMFMVHSDDEEEEEVDQVVEQLHRIACDLRPNEELLVYQESYWRELSNEFSIHQQLPTANIQTSGTKCPKKDLEENGYFVMDSFIRSIDTAAYRRLVQTLRSRNWPPVFAWMYDDLWQLLVHIWPIMEDIVGEDCILDPSIFLWALTPRLQAQKFSDHGEVAGNNFGFPHRDFDYTESFYPKSQEMKLVNIWMPLTESTLDNGCLVVVPKEFDELFHQPDHKSHMKSCIPCYDKQHQTKLSFDLQGSRPLPCSAGSLIAWQGNLIHWGSRCSKKSNPRISIACTFRAASTLEEDTETHLTKSKNSPPVITKSSLLSLSLKQRMRLIVSSLFIYENWCPLQSSNFCSDILRKS